MYISPQLPGTDSTLISPFEKDINTKSTIVQTGQLWPVGFMFCP